MPISYFADQTPAESYSKMPGDYLDYILSWAREFGSNGGSPGDTLNAITTWTVSPTGTLSITTPIVVSGGLAALFWAASGTPGLTYTVTLTANTTAGRIYNRELFIPVAQDVG